MVLLSKQQANDILGLAGLSGQVVVDTVKQYNHVYQPITSQVAFECRQPYDFVNDDADARWLSLCKR